MASPAMSNPSAAWLEQLGVCRTGVLLLAERGDVETARLRALADAETELALALDAAPLDPVANVRQAHAHAVPALRRLARYDPAAPVAIGAEGYSYTPRKVLRRVLDHALDHLNQIEQWLDWQRTGQPPTPTDGWAASTDTLAEDILPLSEADLASWLWRIDLVVELVAQRAAHLTSEQLDWAPPDGGWSLRFLLHHLAHAERFYALWLELTPSTDATARYAAASTRLHERLRAAAAEPLAPGFGYSDGEDWLTAEDVAHKALAAEERLLAVVAPAGE